MGSNSVIKVPQVYITPDLKEGESVAVHTIYPKQTFLNLKFEEGGTLNSTYQSVLSVDDFKILDNEPELKKRISEIEGRVISLGNLYTAYSYLLVIKNKDIRLLSTTLKGLALGYEITKEISEKIEIPVDTPSWIGMFTRANIYAFVEDIFIQKF